MKKRTVAFFILLCFIGISFTWAATEQKEYYDDGKVRLLKKINDLGDITEERYLSEDGTLEKYIKYDNLGHKIAEANYGENGSLRENADGWAAMRWLHKGGNTVAEGYYGGDGKLKERKQYNDGGDLIAKQYYGDSKPLPAEEYNPDPTFAGESLSFYDKYGRPEGTTSVEYNDVLFPWYWDMED